MAYVYIHFTPEDTPFYVGIGSDDKYKRAYNKKGRSYSWKDVAYKNDFKVEIVLDNISWEEACDKEKEFISLYGRKDKKQGTLTNLTDGGEGQYGRKDSEETKKKKQKPKTDQAKANMKLSHDGRDYSYLKQKAGAKKGIKKSPEHTAKIQIAAHNKKIKIWCPELDIIFTSVTEASKTLNTSPGHISNIINSITNKTRSGLTLIKL